MTFYPNKVWNLHSYLIPVFGTTAILLTGFLVSILFNNKNNCKGTENHEKCSVTQTA
jgi:hypothetical protein